MEVYVSVRWVLADKIAPERHETGLIALEDCGETHTGQVWSEIVLKDPEVYPLNS